MTSANLESTKQLILAEINTAPEPAFLQEVLHFIRFLKEQYRMEDEYRYCRSRSCALRA
jgi:hypothetical protein